MDVQINGILDGKSKQNYLNKKYSNVTVDKGKCLNWACTVIMIQTNNPIDYA